MSDYYQFTNETGSPVDYYQLVDDNNCLCEEIERLNNKVEELMTLYTTEREVKEEYKRVINEFEEDFERKIQSCTIGAETTTNDFYCRLHIATLKKWLNKIKELKG